MSLIPKRWSQYTTVNKWALLASLVTVLMFLFFIYDRIFPPAPAQSPSDLVVKDDNPTKLDVYEITIEKWLGDSEPYITVNVRNISKRTATAVIPSFQGEKDTWQFTPTKTATTFQHGVSIEPQSTMKFPVAPVSEFLSKIARDCPRCSLLGVGREANIPMSVTLVACENRTPCEISSRSKPLGINLHYKNIFNEPVHQFFIGFAYLATNIALGAPSPIANQSFKRALTFP